MSTASPEKNTRVGRFLLKEVVGDGEAAQVWRAEIVEGKGQGQQAALKLIRPRLVEKDPDFMQQYVAEAGLSRTLDHSNVVPVIDVGRWQGRFYIATEYVDGPTLKGLLTASRRLNRPMPLEVALEITRQVCMGLDSAQRARDKDGLPLHMLHLDLKPANVFIAKGGIVKVADFGVMRAESDMVHTDNIGLISRAVRYMSPEQAEGRADLDVRSDLFSLCLILFEMVTGGPLYTGTAPGPLVLAAQDANLDGIEDRLPDSEAYPKLLKFFAKGLAKNRTHRFTNPAGLLRGLAAVGRGLPEPELVAFVESVLPSQPAAAGASTAPGAAARTGGMDAAAPPQAAAHGRTDTAEPDPARPGGAGLQTPPDSSSAPEPALAQTSLSPERSLGIEWEQLERSLSTPRERPERPVATRPSPPSDASDGQPPPSATRDDSGGSGLPLSSFVELRSDLSASAARGPRPTSDHVDSQQAEATPSDASPAAAEPAPPPATLQRTSPPTSSPTPPPGDAFASEHWTVPEPKHRQREKAKRAWLKPRFLLPVVGAVLLGMWVFSMVVNLGVDVRAPEPVRLDLSQGGAAPKAGVAQSPAAQPAPAAQPSAQTGGSVAPSPGKMQPSSVANPPRRVLTQPTTEGQVVYRAPNKNGSTPMPNARLSLNATPAASVRVDGELKGGTPTDELILPPGPHMLTFKWLSGKSVRHSVTLTASRRTRCVARLDTESVSCE